MKTRRLFITTAAALMLAFLAAPTGAFAEGTDFAAKDVKDRWVKTENYRGKMLLVFINSHLTSKQLKPVTEKLILKYGDHPELGLLTIVDLRDLEFYKRPFAKEHIAKAHDRTVRRIKALLKKHGKPTIAGLSKNLHIIADFEGDYVKKFKHWPATKIVTIVALGKDGQYLGSYRPNELGKVMKIIDANITPK